MGLKNLRHAAHVWSVVGQELSVQFEKYACMHGTYSGSHVRSGFKLAGKTRVGPLPSVEFRDPTSDKSSPSRPGRQAAKIEICITGGKTRFVNPLQHEKDTGGPFQPTREYAVQDVVMPT